MMHQKSMYILSGRHRKTAYRLIVNVLTGLQAQERRHNEVNCCQGGASGARNVLAREFFSLRQAGVRAHSVTPTHAARWL